MVTGKTFLRLTLIAAILAWLVVSLGAYTRLSHAGLGCPDWPGCYGGLGVPATESQVSAANEAYPERPLEAPKAWKEMIHRYFAGTLGILILVLALLAWLRRSVPGQAVWLPTVLVALVVFQVLLGMWTVTLLLKPLVVTGHLMGGFTTLALLYWLALRQGLIPTGGRDLMAATATRALRPWAVIAVVVLSVQIALGGWTSANYAALACPDFPTCQGQWLPPMAFSEGFTLWRGLGIDYEYGVLENGARAAIHFTHRLGALLTLLYLGWLAIRALRTRRNPLLVATGGTLLLLLAVQVGLGIANVLLGLPLFLAVAHNATAALLLLVVVTMIHVLNPPSPVRMAYEVV